MAARAATSSEINPLQLFANYPFKTDEAYQQGLANILAGLQEKSEEEKEETLRRSRVFYFNRITGYSLTVDNALECERSRSSHFTDTTPTPPSHAPGQPSSAPPEPSSVNEHEPDEQPRILTFAELNDLIQQGKVDQIPNNRTIPDGLNDAPPSESTVPARKKPWETVSSA